MTSSTAHRDCLAFFQWLDYQHGLMKVLKQPQSITLYSRALCGWCLDAKNWLDRMGWKYEVADTGKNPANREKAIQLSGQTLVPVIEIDGLVLGDFDTGQLEEFLKKHGYLEELRIRN